MPMEPLTVLAASTERQALIPMAAGYLILMPALALGLRRLYRPPATQPSPESSPGSGPAASGGRGGRAALARHLGGTVLGGYLLLMAVVVAYYYAVAQLGPGFLEAAVTGTALLIALAAPVFAAAVWLTGRLRGGDGHPVSHRVRPGRPAPGPAGRPGPAPADRLSRLGGSLRRPLRL